MKNAPQSTEGTAPTKAADPIVEPSPDEVRVELASILKSDAFAGAARQQRLLKHLVEKRLGGATSELKEYTLGVEVFDRGENFDSRLDPIVRVEASRLRSRLQKYYDGAGVDDPVRIALPRGAYVPSFTVKEALVQPDEPAEAAPSTPITADPAPVLDEPPSDVTSARPAVSVDGPENRLPFVGKLGLAASAIILVTVIFLLVRRPAPVAGAPDFLKFRRLTSDTSPCTTPTFSPDGTEVAYARRDGAHWQIYSRELNGMEGKPLTGGSNVDNVQPAWAPQGEQIAFRSERDGGGIFVVDAQTLNVSRLASFGYHPAWSPDGKTIAFSTGTFREPGETYLAQPSTLELLDVASGKVSGLGSPELVRDAVQPSWSPDGKRLAYWSTEDGERDIWTTALPEPDGDPARPVRVTHDAWTDWSPTWSPDGRYLYFSSDRGGAMNLWRVRIDEQTGNPLTGPEPVTTPSSYSGWVTFAHSGKQFAYVHRLASSQLYSAPFSIDKGIDLEHRLQLTAGERIVREPSASPDGKWIAVRVQDPQEDLAIIHPDGSDFHRITNDAFADRGPHWSPDGKEIVFLSNRSDNTQFQVWSIHPDGTGLKQLTQHGPVSNAWTPDGTLVAFPGTGKPFALEHPGKPLVNWELPDIFRPIAWSPDGKSVVGRMRSNAFGQAALFVLSPGASDFWQIATNAPYTSVAWLQDGSHLLFSGDDGIHLADIGSHTLRAEPINLQGQIHSRFAASRDGSSLYFVVSDDEEDIWTASE